MSAQALILSGYGLNSEEETKYGFDYNGINAKIIHINDLIDNPNLLNDYQILAVPGGFSYGDDTGSGNAFAQKMKLSLQDTLQEFTQRDTLTIGICNGCQILSNLGLVNGVRDFAVTYNANSRYQCRWVNLAANTNNTSPWLINTTEMYIPVAHGEGRFMMSEEKLTEMKANNQIAFTYTNSDGTPAKGKFPENPNGSIDDIAAVTSADGKVLAIMPHPERGMFSSQRNDYDSLKDAAAREGKTLSKTNNGMKIFENAANYFGVKTATKAA